MSNFIVEVVRRDEDAYQQYHDEAYFGELMQEIVNVLKDSI